MALGIIGAGLVIVLVSWAVSVYNGLVQLKVRGDNAWSDIDVQLKRRYDVIPNIVATVEGYAHHEKAPATMEAGNIWIIVLKSRTTAL